ncbi:hypothetical protein [Anatilimnocola floriformis]|uniref:hypothetical protein n=1 Tax=Anatilimnocola floriformis TaxID=2948575 RepID=UPI0020C233CD|nr:hypothetical protein [Anatilimnocola floriformis]
MAGNKYLKNASGTITEEAAIQSSAGAGDAGKIPALDSAGKLDNSMMPTGIGGDTKQIVASEALSAGNLINVYNNAGTLNMRKADATTAGKEANGFVLSSVSSSATGTAYFEQLITGLSGLTVGAQYYLSTTAGTPSTTVPSTSGNIVQKIGRALSATELLFMPQPDPITLA